MRITLKLFATLSDLLPPGAQANAAEVEVPDGMTPNQIIDQYRVPREMAHLVLQNGAFLSPENRDQATLEDGDTLAVWPPIAGG